MVRERKPGFCCSLLAFGACLTVAGCGGNTESPKGPSRPLRIETISFAMPEGANENWPAQVALVRVPDVDLVKELMKIKADEWFGEGGTTFQNAHPEAFYADWEIVPGVDVGPDEVELDEDVAGVLFCKIRKAPPPLRVERDGDVRILVNDEGCTLQGGEPSSEPSALEKALDRILEPAESLIEELQGILEGG